MKAVEDQSIHDLIESKGEDKARGGRVAREGLPDDTPKLEGPGGDVEEDGPIDEEGDLDVVHTMRGRGEGLALFITRAQVAEEALGESVGGQSPNRTRIHRGRTGRLGA